jgi:hypothetical protein
MLGDKPAEFRIVGLGVSTLGVQIRQSKLLVAADDQVVQLPGLKPAAGIGLLEDAENERLELRFGHSK